MGLRPGANPGAPQPPPATPRVESMVTPQPVFVPKPSGNPPSRGRDLPLEAARPCGNTPRGDQGGMLMGFVACAKGPKMCNYLILFGYFIYQKKGKFSGVTPI